MRQVRTGASGGDISGQMKAGGSELRRPVLGIRAMTRADHAGFLALVEAARDALPGAFRQAAADVVVQVRDWPEAALLRQMGIADPLELTGLYDGVPLTEKSSMDQPQGPDMIWLFREPILAEWRARGDVELAELIAHVLVHEYAHHFGWSDAGYRRDRPLVGVTGLRPARPRAGV